MDCKTDHSGKFSFLNFDNTISLSKSPFFHYPYYSPWLGFLVMSLVVISLKI